MHGARGPVKVPFQNTNAIADQRRLMRRFWQSALVFWRTDIARGGGLATVLVVIVLVQLVVQIFLNLWNRNFFDALERKDASSLWLYAQLFVPLAAASIFLAAASVWGRMTVQRSWREALTRHILDRWLPHERYRHLNHLAKGSENPEYRIAVDVRVATDAPIDLTLALLSSILTAIAFFSVLWSIGGHLDVMFFGTIISIPGYLVIGVIVYSATITGLMNFFGHHLTNVIERLNQSEAELRGAVDAFREGGSPTELDSETARESLQLKLQATLLWWREFCWQLVRTTLVSHGNFLFAPVVAWFLCAPKYLSGTMSLGELTQAAAAFVTVQSAFNWLVDNYQRISDWRSSAHRVATLLMALDGLEEKR